MLTLDKLNKIKDAKLRALKSRHILYQGVQLFRSLPTQLRKLQTEEGTTKPITKESYKARLDRYLRTIPDEPTCARRHRRSESNSILHQTAHRDKTGDKWVFVEQDSIDVQ